MNSLRTTSEMPWYCHFIKTMRLQGITVVFLILGAVGFAQTAPKAAIAVDSTSIIIGSQLRYQIQVETNKGDLVVFPEGQTFTPLEMIGSLAIDTTDLKARQTLTKQYMLTQFDSGTYTVPRQKILIGKQTIMTDSLQVEVRDLVVDTTKQKLYDIKPLIAVEVPNDSWKKYIWWVLGALLIIGLLLFLIFRAQKEKAIKAQQLPAYERALLALQKIDNDHLLEEEAFKEYYSQLSDTARQYLDEEVYDRAMESTTDELILKLEEQTKAGELHLNKEVIVELKRVLETADLAKFAKSKPDVGTARADRNSIESFIKETKIAIPQLTEEELLLDDEYRMAQEAKQKKKKIIIAVVTVVSFLIFTVIGFVVVRGFDFVKDNVVGHPTKDLVKGDWIRSAYGTPPVFISTPQVLKRVDIQVPEELAGQLTTSTFNYGSLLEMFSISLNTSIIQGQTEFDLELAVEGSIKMIEQQGVKNMMTKNEPYETLGGVEGLKTFGTADFPVLGNDGKTVKGNYVSLLFNHNEGLQQIMMTWKEEDRYAKEMVDRILNSVELKNEEE